MKKCILLAMLFLSFSGMSQKTMPNIEVKSLDGSTKNISTSFNEKDKLYVFVFWATWCAPCIEELNAISEVYEDWKSEANVEVVAISLDDSRTEKRVKPLVNGKGWEYTVLLDNNQTLKRSLGISNPPYLLVVKNNEILFTQNGHTPGSEAELFEKLKSFK
jgi:thiol-disulfide isomerase/thioredoxin